MTTFFSQGLHHEEREEKNRKKQERRNKKKQWERIAENQGCGVAQ
jgi:hypothetical protein